jgi:hypothetical protein
MVDQRFNELREELLRAGVGARHVRRAVLEIQSHFQQLIDEECERGASDRDAHMEAHRRLGTNLVLVQRYAARPELHAWSRRWPSIWFLLLPLITYLAVFAATFMAVLAVAHQMAPYLQQIHIAPQMTYGIDLAARIVLLWLLPSFVSTAFAVLAYRRRVSLRWSLLGIVLISVLASLINVGVKFTGGLTPGSVGAGIGLSPESLPGQLTRAAVLASLTLIPLWLSTRRAQRGYNRST